jgi:uncharacterized lipoprotein YddW (UPF0748 family)
MNFKLHLTLTVLVTMVVTALGLYAVKDEVFQAQIKKEIRGTYWPATGSQIIYSKKNIENAIKKMTDLNMNTIYFDAFSRNHTLYQSAVNKEYTGLPILKNGNLTGRDPLRETLDATKNKKIKTIAWFEYGFLGFGNSELLVKNPTWVTLNSEGKEQSKEGTIWINPFLPEVRTYIKRIITELVTNYPDLDGIQFDDHMAFNSDLGYDKYTLGLYKAETSKTAPLKPSTTDPLQDPIWKHWLDWRTNKVTAFVGEVSNMIKGIVLKKNPNFKISAAVNYEDYAYKQFCQKWTDWVNSKYVDEITIQVYRNKIENFTKATQLPENFATLKKMPVSIGIGLVVFSEAQPFSLVKQEVELVRKNGFSGVNFWYHEFLDYGPNEKSIDRINNMKTLFPTYVERL